MTALARGLNADRIPGSPLPATDDHQGALSADRLIRIIHFQSELAKTRMDYGVVLQRTDDLAQLLTRADGAVVELVDGPDMVYRAATRDRLTGLANRASSRDQLGRMVATARRSGEGFALLMLDMDGLKAINDTCGHLAGDEAIRTLARRLLAHTRGSDIAARLGGDEFAVLLTSAHDAQGAAIASAKLAEDLEGPFLHEGKAHPMGASLGCASFPGDADGAEALLELADQRMQAAKRARRAVPR